MTATKEEVAPVQTSELGGQNHYVHMECQTGDGFVVALCGFLLDVAERDDSGSEPPCEACHTRPYHCSNCGAEEA